MPKSNKSKYSLFDIGVFLIAVIALTEFFTSSHYFRSGTEDIKGIFVAVISASIFLLAMVYLAYSIYAEEKKRGNLRKTFYFFDWIDLRIEMWRDSIAKRKEEIGERV